MGSLPKMKRDLQKTRTAKILCYILLVILIVLVNQGTGLVQKNEREEMFTSSENATNCTKTGQILVANTISLKKEKFLRKLQTQCKNHKASSFFCNNLHLLVTLTTGSSLCVDKNTSRGSVQNILSNNSVYDNTLDFNDSNMSANNGGNVTQYFTSSRYLNNFHQFKEDEDNTTTRSSYVDNVKSDRNPDYELEQKEINKRDSEDRTKELEDEAIFEEDAVEGGGDGAWEEYEARQNVEHHNVMPSFNKGAYENKESDVLLQDQTSVIVHEEITKDETEYKNESNIINNEETENVMGKDELYNQRIQNDIYTHLKDVFKWILGPERCHNYYGNVGELKERCMVTLIKGRSIIEWENKIKDYSRWFVDTTRQYVNALTEVSGNGDMRSVVGNYSNIWRRSVDNAMQWIISSVQQYMAENGTLQFYNISQSLGRAMAEWQLVIPDTARMVMNEARKYYKGNKTISEMLKLDDERWSRKLNVFMNWTIDKVIKYLGDVSNIRVDTERSSNNTRIMARKLLQKARQFVRSYLPESMSARSMVETARDFAGWTGFSSEATGRDGGKGKGKGKLKGAMMLALLIKGGMAMAAGMAGVKMLAFKALMVSAVSLTIASVVALKKLGGGKGGGGGGGGKAVLIESGGGGHKGPWESGGGGGGHGGPWDSGGGGGGHGGPWVSGGGGGGGGHGGGPWESVGGGLKGAWDSFVGGGHGGHNGPWESSYKGGAGGGGGPWESGGGHKGGGGGWDSGGGGGWDGGGGGKGGGGWSSGGGGGKGAGWDSGGGGEGWSSGGGGGKGAGWDSGGGGGGGWSSGGGGGGKGPGWDSGGGGGGGWSSGGGDSGKGAGWEGGGGGGSKGGGGGWDSGGEGDAGWSSGGGGGKGGGGGAWDSGGGGGGGWSGGGGKGGGGWSSGGGGGWERSGNDRKGGKQKVYSLPELLQNGLKGVRKRSDEMPVSTTSTNSLIPS